MNKKPAFLILLKHQSNAPVKKGKYFLLAGLALLVISILAGAFSEMIIEDILGIERAFGEEPLSIRLARYSLAGFVLGLGLMLYGGWLCRDGIP